MEDLRNFKFGRLTVLGNPKTKNKKTYWLCECECGTKKFIRADSLKGGSIQSCGCLHKEISKKQGRELYEKFLKYADKHSIKHGLSQHRLYNIWENIKTRCYNSKSSFYCYYGARGIIMCDEWLNDFENFYKWSISNGYKNNLSIDRINNNGNYEPLNCRWVDKYIQANNKRNNRYYKIENQVKTLKQWAEFYKIDYKTVHARIKRNWDIVKALTTPIQQYKGLINLQVE